MYFIFFKLFFSHLHLLQYLFAANIDVRTLNRRGSGTVPFNPDSRKPSKQSSVSDDKLKFVEPDTIKLTEERDVDKWMGQTYRAVSDQSPSDLVPPFIQFLRRNEDLLAKKVSQLSIMLREAKGEYTALPAVPAPFSDVQQCLF